MDEMTSGSISTSRGIAPISPQVVASLASGIAGMLPELIPSVVETVMLIVRMPPRAPIAPVSPPSWKASESFVTASVPNCVNSRRDGDFQQG